MEQNKILQLVYTLFLGVLIAIFVGVGINTFYAPPTGPTYPKELNVLMGKEPTSKQQELQLNWENESSKFDKEKMQPYNRNVSIMAISAAVALLVVSILFEKKIKVMSDGVMLGGLFTLFYSIGRGFASQDNKYMFAMVSISLALVLLLGYHRFVKPKSTAVKVK